MYPSHSASPPASAPSPLPSSSHNPPTPVSSNANHRHYPDAYGTAPDVDMDVDALDAASASVTEKLLPPPDYYGTIPTAASSSPGTTALADAGGFVVNHHHYHHYAPSSLGPHSPTASSFYPPASSYAPLSAAATPPTGFAHIAATLSSLAKRTLVCFTRAVAICCCFAFLTVLLAALTAGSMVHFAPGRLPGLSGDPALTVVDGIEWPCAASGVDPIRVFREQWTVPATSLFVNVSGVASGAVRYAGFDVDPDGLARSTSPRGQVMVDVSVHVSHEHLIPMVVAHADPLAGVVSVQTPESRDMSRIFRECVIASVNISMVSWRHASAYAQDAPALKSLKVNTVNLHHYLSSMTLRRRSPAVARALPAPMPAAAAVPAGWTGLDDLTIATTNGHIQLTPSGPWSIHSSLSLATTNGNVDLAGPLRFAGTSLAAESTNGNLHLRAMLRSPPSASLSSTNPATRVTASTTNGNIDLAVADLVPAARVAAAATNGNVQVTAGPHPDLTAAQLRAATALGSAQVASRAAGWPRRTVNGNGWMGGVAELHVRRVQEGAGGEQEVVEVAQGEEAPEDQEPEQVMGIASHRKPAGHAGDGDLVGDDGSEAHVRASSTTGNAMVAMDDLLLVRVDRR